MSNHLTNIVVVGFIVRGDKIFIARRAATKTTFPDQYELIGGHLDPGETLEEALKREIKEEVGLDIRVGELIDAFTYESEGALKVELCYICYQEDDKAEPLLNPEDHSTCLWITESEIDKFNKEDDETVALRKAFAYIKEKK